MSAVNKYSSFGGPGGIKVVPGLYVDYEKRPFGIDIHMYVYPARGYKSGATRPEIG